MSKWIRGTSFLGELIRNGFWMSQKIHMQKCTWHNENILWQQRHDVLEETLKPFMFPTHHLHLFVPDLASHLLPSLQHVAGSPKRWTRAEFGKGHW